VATVSAPNPLTNPSYSIRFITAGLRSAVSTNINGRVFFFHSSAGDISSSTDYDPDFDESSLSIDRESGVSLKPMSDARMLLLM